MCKSKIDGGERCQGSPMGKSLYRLYRERSHASKDGDTKKEALLTQQIHDLKEADEFYGGRMVAPHSLELSTGVEAVLDSLKKSGNPLVIGGAVRDSYLGADNKDIDIEVHNTTIDNLVQALKDDGFRVDEVGKQFGVLKVSKKGVVSDIDVSVPRRENNVGAGHRGFEVSLDSDMTIEEACARRDFTFNAVMYDHARKVTIDPYHGVDDLKTKTLKHVSPAFAEDPLRVLRAFQFASRFDLKIHPETSAMCQSLRGSYSELPKERVIDEWEKFYGKSEKPVSGIKVLQKTGWDDTFDGLRDSLLKKSTQDALSRLPQSKTNDRGVMGSSLIASTLPESSRHNFVTGTILGTKRQQKALAMANFDPKTVKDSYSAQVVARDMAKTGFTFTDYKEHCELTKNKKGIEACQIAEKAQVMDKPSTLLIQGKDVLEASGKRGGKWMGHLLRDVEDKQYRGEFKSKKEALDYALSKIPE